MIRCHLIGVFDQLRHNIGAVEVTLDGVRKASDYLLSLECVAAHHVTNAIHVALDKPRVLC